jgi:peptidoglycan/LPS O-acetylase OafA/YrhL
VGNESAKSTSTYYAPIDGLRAVAVAAVLLYHHDIGWLPGGYLGVEIFFVISGFIITMQLARQWDRSARIAYADFLVRRGFRLFPGMAAMLVATWLTVALFWPAELGQLRADTPAGLAFLQNWHMILQELSYFDAIGRPRLLQHLWSLGVEFQFYLLWPLACVAVLRLPRRLQALAVVLFAAASYLWMAGLAGELGDADASRVYLGTDTRLGAILLGAALALALRGAPRLTPGVVARVGLPGASLLGLALLAVALRQLEDNDPQLYQGGFAAVALATALSIGSLFLCPRGPVAGLLGSRLMTAIGVRAYSLYLWHWPVFCLTQADVDLPLEGVPLFLVRLGITAALSELSYSVVEMPFRDGQVQTGLRAMLRDPLLRPGVLAASGLYSGLGAVLGVAMLTPQTLQQASLDAAAMLSPPAAAAENDFFPPLEHARDLPPPAETVPPRSVSPSAGEGVSPAAETSPAATTEAEPFAATAAPTLATAAAGGCFKPAGAPRPPLAVVRGAQYVQRMHPRDLVKRHVYAIGDSVMLGAVGTLDSALGDIDVDAKVGRQLGEALPLLRERIARGVLSDIVVIHLGNNGPFRAAELTELLDLLREVPRVVLVNLKLPRSYEGRNNELLAAAAAEPRVRVVDWRKAGFAGGGAFGRDGIHLTPAGAKLYAARIAAAVCQGDSP